MSKGKITIIFFQFKALKNLIKEVRFLMSGDKNMNFQEVKSTEELLAMINKEENSIILSSLEGKDDLTNLISALKQSRKFIKSKRIRYAAFNLTNDNTTQEILKKLGCKDVFTKKEATARKIKFKINLWRKMLKPPLLGMDAADDGVEQLLKGGDGVKKERPSKKTTSNNVKFLDSLKTSFDFWILKSENDIYQDEQSWWHARMKGPSPSYAYWELSSESKNSGPPTWRLVVEDHAPKEFREKAGAWFFEGDRPFYSSKENKWFFTGASFKLFLVDKGQREYWRLYTEEKNIYVAKNGKESLESTFDNNLPGADVFNGEEYIYREGEPAVFKKKEVEKKKAAPKSSEKKPDQASSYQAKVPDTPRISEDYIQEVSTDAATRAVVFAKDGKDSAEIAYTCEFDDLFDEEVSLIIRKEDSFPSDKVRVLLELNLGEKVEKVSFYGEIEEREKYDETRDVLIIHSDHIDDKLLEDFAKVLEERQGNIQNFLKLAQGE